MGNNTSILDRDTSKWRTVQEAPPNATFSDNEAGNSGEVVVSGGENDDSIFEETKTSGRLLLLCKTISIDSSFMRHKLCLS